MHWLYRIWSFEIYQIIFDCWYWLYWCWFFVDCGYIDGWEFLHVEITDWSWQFVSAGFYRIVTQTETQTRAKWMPLLTHRWTCWTDGSWDTSTVKTYYIRGRLPSDQMTQDSPVWNGSLGQITSAVECQRFPCSTSNQHSTFHFIPIHFIPAHCPRRQVGRHRYWRMLHFQLHRIRFLISF